MDFKKKMRMGSNVKDAFEAQANKTQITPATDRNVNNASPNVNKVDMNMTVPLNSEAMAQGRKAVNEFVGQPISKVREASINYNTI